MEISMESIRGAVEKRWSTQDMVHDWCNEYGEPGYSIYSGDTPVILLGDWNERKRIHKRLFAQLESQGVQFEWYDEWEAIDGKAYRSQPDSYGWECSIALTNDCEWLTPEDDLETWIEWALEGNRLINDSQVPNLARKLTEAGWTRMPDEDAYENGWHPGQTDEPSEIRKAILAEHGPDTQIVFALVENSQFYIRFAAYYRIPEEEQ